MSDRPSSSHVVLVVDDEVLLRLNASEALQDAGCATYEAEATDDALRVLKDHPDITVLFTDINMPGERDGMALAEIVHCERPDVRLIITSGREQPAPADIPDDGQFIGKPYDLDAMVEIIRAMPEKR